MKEISYPCKFDRTMQKALVQFATGDAPRPLVVALHTWSYTYAQFNEAFEAECAKRNWHLIHPDFRGPNSAPEGCGSDLVVSDLEDAVRYMQSVAQVDSRRIYLVGGSGGGHCSLLLAGRRPDLWTAVSAWCPITDVAKWYSQCRGTVHQDYALHIVQACNGNPLKDPVAIRQAAVRSPLTWLPNAANLPVDINTGIHDGHTGSVPVSHALEAYNVLADPADQIPADVIQKIVETEQVPAEFADQDGDPSYGERKIHLRKQSNLVRMTLFEGGHDLLPESAFLWLERQVRGEKPDWAPGPALESQSLKTELSK